MVKSHVRVSPSVFDDNITDVNADAKFDPLDLRHVDILFGHAALNFDGFHHKASRPWRPAPFSVFFAFGDVVNFAARSSSPSIAHFLRILSMTHGQRRWRAYLSRRRIYPERSPKRELRRSSRRIL